MEKIVFKIEKKPEICKAFFGKNLFNEIALYLKKNNLASKYVIITDSNIEKIHGKKLQDTLKKQGFDVLIISFKAGEKSKTRKTKEIIEHKMLVNSCGRDTLILALGGGVTGDIAGFTAATYMRGIPFIQIPTSTMACADSSYGGKTGVDTTHGKNLIGAFHNPIAIFIDTELLKTIDKRNYINGIVEIIKHGLIMDKSFFNFIKNNIETIKNKESKDYDKIMQELLLKSINIKREVVEKDPNEKNIRKILNYGHTIGHAVETLSNYKLLHGEAVAIGISVESFISYKLGILSKSDFEEQINIFKKVGLNITIPKKIPTLNIIKSMKLDKKSKKGIPEFVLLESIGKVKLGITGGFSMPVDKKTLIKCINEYKNIFN